MNFGFPEVHSYIADLYKALLTLINLFRNHGVLQLHSYGVLLLLWPDSCVRKKEIFSRGIYFLMHNVYIRINTHINLAKNVERLLQQSIFVYAEA